MGKQELASFLQTLDTLGKSVGEINRQRKLDDIANSLMNSDPETAPRAAAVYPNDSRVVDGLANYNRVNGTSLTASGTKPRTGGVDEFDMIQEAQKLKDARQSREMTQKLQQMRLDRQGQVTPSRYGEDGMTAKERHDANLSDQKFEFQKDRTSAQALYHQNQDDPYQQQLDSEAGLGTRRSPKVTGQADPLALMKKMGDGWMASTGIPVDHGIRAFQNPPPSVNGNRGILTDDYDVKGNVIGPKTVPVPDPIFDMYYGVYKNAVKPPASNARGTETKPGYVQSGGGSGMIPTSNTALPEAGKRIRQNGIVYTVNPDGSITPEQ